MPIHEKYLAKFEFNNVYHVFNRTIGKEILFCEEENYSYFLELFQKHMLHFLDAFCYSLQPNHFHFMVRVKDRNENTRPHPLISNQFRKLFIAYTNAFNKKYSRTGGLFQTPFRRILVKDDHYFTQLVSYIHHNHIHHKTWNFASAYPWSSYNEILTEENSWLLSGELIDWFGGREQFVKYHDMSKIMYEECPFYIE